MRAAVLVVRYQGLGGYQLLECRTLENEGGRPGVCPSASPLCGAPATI